MVCILRIGQPGAGYGQQQDTTIDRQKLSHISFIARQGLAPDEH